MMVVGKKHGNLFGLEQWDAAHKVLCSFALSHASRLHGGAPNAKALAGVDRIATVT